MLITHITPITVCTYFSHHTSYAQHSIMVLTLPQHIFDKYEDEDVTVNVDPEKCTDKDFRELMIYLALTNLRDNKALKAKVIKQGEEIQSLVTAMNTKDEEIDSLHTLNVTLNNTVQSLRDDVATLRKDFVKQGDEVLALQRYTREWGLRFNGIPETKDENCIKLLEDKLAQVGLPHVKIENAHRLAAMQDGSTRTIAARCFSRVERREVLNKINRKKLFDLGVPVFESLCQFDADLKRRYAPKMKELYDEGHRVYYAKGNLFVDGRKYTGPVPPPLPPRPRGPRTNTTDHY